MSSTSPTSPTLGQEFMLLFRFQPSQQEPTPEQLQEMQKHWGEFIGTLAMQGRLVSTHQLGFAGSLIHADQRTEATLHLADNQLVGGNMILRADSLESATELAKKCPVLLMGGTVEVRDILPM